MTDEERIYSQTIKMVEDNETLKQICKDNNWPFTDHSEALNEVLKLCTTSRDEEVRDVFRKIQSSSAFSFEAACEAFAHISPDSGIKAEKHI